MFDERIFFVSSPQNFASMLSIILFISGGELFIILLFILIFFGADKIPEFTRMMSKGVREFKKATDDLKRELDANTSGVMNDIRSIQNQLTENLTREITEPLQKTINETSKPFEEIQDQYNRDFYYDDQNYAGSYGNEYQKEATSSLPEKTVDNIPDTTVDQDDTNEIKPEQT